MFKIVVAGSMFFTDYDLFSSKMDFYLKNIADDITIISENMMGTGMLAKKYAKERNYEIKQYSIDLESEENPIHNRNKQMLQDVDACVCFFDGRGRGTKNMIKLAKKYNIKLRVVSINKRNPIKIINGNIFDSKENIICHQVNCQGVMGSGLAKQIKDKYPNVFDAYKEIVSTVNSKSDLLGKCQLIKINNTKYVANLFGQLHYGTNKQQTNYEALKKSFLTLKQQAENLNLSVAIPYGIGCGLGGGKWQIVYEIINEIFTGNVEVTIYKLINE